LCNQVQANDDRLSRIIGRDAADATAPIFDPFHDRPIDYRGRPNRDQVKQVSQTITHTQTISKPTPGAGNWSFCIFTTPFDHGHSMYPARGLGGGKMKVTGYNGTDQSIITFPANGYQMNGYGASGFQIGPTNIHAWNSDVEAFFPSPDGTFTTPPDYTDSHDVLKSADTSVNYRVSGHAFEVVNTTADLYKQGTCTVVRVPSAYTKLDNVLGGILGNVGLLRDATDTTQCPIQNAACPVSAHRCQMPPASLEDASLAGAVKWGAVEGCYSQCKIDPDNDFSQAAPMNPILDTNGMVNIGSNSGTDTVMPSQDWTAYAGNLTSADAVGATNYCIVAPTTFRNHVTERDVVCAYFTGLSSESTFTITIKYQVDIRPRVFNPFYAITVPMAKLPPEATSQSDFAYQHMMRVMPPGVPLRMNPSGEFWASLVSGLGKVAATAGPLLGVNGALAGGLANQIATAAADKIRANAAKNSKGASKKK
jgi:hypothetical protein